MIFCVHNFTFLLICFAGPVAGSPSLLRDREGNPNLNPSFSQGLVSRIRGSIYRSLMFIFHLFFR